MSNLVNGFCLYVYKFDNQSNVLFNSSCSSGASGTMLLGVAPINGSTYNAYAYFFDGTQYNYLRGATYTYPSSDDNPFGNYGLFLQFLLTLGMASMLYINTSLGLIMVPVSLILGSYIGLNAYSQGAMLGVTIACVAVIFVMLTMQKR